MSKNVIVNIRGTSGSGKSTIAFEFLKRFPNEALTGKDGKIKGYRVNTAEAGLDYDVFILGKYTTVCGGLDACPTQAEAGDLAVKAYEQGGHVLAEGLLASAAGPKGAFTDAIYQTGAAIFAILDTPLQVCLDRVRARRAAKGNNKPFNEKNTRDKWTQVHSTAKALHKLGYDVRAIDHTRAFEDVLQIFREAEENELR